MDVSWVRKVFSGAKTCCNQQGVVPDSKHLDLRLLDFILSVALNFAQAGCRPLVGRWKWRGKQWDCSMAPSS